MNGRRSFLRLGLGLAAAWSVVAWTRLRASSSGTADDPATLFLCGDVMPGRGIDQIFPQPSDPTLYEPFVRDARRYLELAEEVSGPIPRKVGYDYVWGDALAELRARQPDLRIINLETSITRSDRPWPKSINYRMHPDNAAMLQAAGIDCCVLANNHVLDWQHDGLRETVASLRKLGIHLAGAGEDLRAAQTPAALPLRGGRRLLVFAAATDDSGVPADWAADVAHPGVHRLPDLSQRTVARMAAIIRRHRRQGDRVVFSLHWGGNWGFEVPIEQRDFAHGLIEAAGVDLVHGHSSHHVKAAEVHRGRLVLYGCGDFINDYEGIEGHEEFRGDLGLMYFPTIAADGRLLALRLMPTRMRRFRIERARGADRTWLRDTLRREYRRLGCDVREGDGGFLLRWNHAGRPARAN